MIGRLGKAPEAKKTKGGQSILNFTLASSETYKDKSGNKQQKTEWHRVVLWERLADVVCKYCRKGSQIFVEGKLQTREWKDKQGNRRFTTEILGVNIQLLDGKNENSSRNQQAKQSNYPTSSNDDYTEDDIPF